MKIIELKRVDAAWKEARVMGLYHVVLLERQLTLLKMNDKAAIVVEMVVKLLIALERSKMRNQILRKRKHCQLSTKGERYESNATYKRMMTRQTASMTASNFLTAEPISCKLAFRVFRSR